MIIDTNLLYCDDVYISLILNQVGMYKKQNLDFSSLTYNWDRILRILEIKGNDSDIVNFLLLFRRLTPDLKHEVIVTTLTPTMTKFLITVPYSDWSLTHNNLDSDLKFIFKDASVASTIKLLN